MDRDITAAIDTLEKVIEGVEMPMEQLQNLVTDLRVQETMDPIQKAKVNVALAYSMNALLYVQYKSQGMSNTDQRQIRLKQELDRVRGYLKKIKAAETRAKGPKLTLDKKAADRFVRHNLDNSSNISVKIKK